jgi:enoyl-CoA hydratase/carnithine racemase
MVELRLDGTVAILTMRYAPYNLLDPELSKLLIDGLRWAAAEAARAIVLRSALRHFSTGADLGAMLAAVEASATSRSTSTPPARARSSCACATRRT